MIIVQSFWPSCCSTVLSGLLTTSSLTSLVLWLPLQATQGPCNTPKPGLLDFVNKAKWEAWRSLGAISQVTTAARSHFSTVQNANANFAQEEARHQYCDLIASLVEAEGGAVAAGSETAAFQTLEVLVEDNITTIRLNRPEKKNAINNQVSVGECVLLA